MFLSVEKFAARTAELEQLRFVDLEPVTPMTSMEDNEGPDAVHCGLPDCVEGPALNLGDEFVGRDRYLWVQKTVALPPHRDGSQVFGLFDFGKTGAGHNSGFESLLYVNGQPYQGVDTNHNDVLLEALAGTSVQLTFMLWTGLEGGGVKKEFRHRIQQAHIGYLHEATDQLYYFCKAIFGALALLPEDSCDRHSLITAMDGALSLINWDQDRFYTTAEPALEYLLGELDKLEKRSEVTVNVVGHTHIDVAWLWRLKHTREKAQRSFCTVLRLMEEFDEYIFLQTQPQLYNYVKNDCPELYQKMKKRIAEGRWEADGGMWLEADCNIPSGEALVRQFLHGISFLKEEFGVSCEYLWLPDVFGYSWALPQILKQCNISTFMTTKISWNQYNTMPNDLFRWRGIDGSEVMTYFVNTPEEDRPLDDRFSTYNGMLTPRAVVGSWKKFRNKGVSHETLISYGFGDGGGGVNRDMLKMRRVMDKVPGLPNVKTSTARDFFRRMHKNLDTTKDYTATWDGELYLEYHRGTYTSQAYNKRMNRKLELALVETEWLESLNYLLGGEYPAEALHKSWETLLRNQFHDIIPGSSIGEVYEDSKKEYAEIAEALTQATATALNAMREPTEKTFTVYHFGSFPRTDRVLLDVEQDGSFFDKSGSPLPSQRTTGGTLVELSMAPLSMQVISFRPDSSHSETSAMNVDLQAKTAETPFYTLCWNEAGQICRLYDKKNGREVLCAETPANLLEIFEDKPVKYDNWDIDQFYTQKRELLACTAPAELVECGALRLMLRFRYAYGHSSFVQDMILYKNSARIDFVTEADWHEDHRLLKAAFPVDIRATKATYDIQFGHVERPTHFNTSWDYARFEVAGHKWGDLSETGYGVSLLNDCKYGYSAKDNVIKLTLLKSGKHPDTAADMGRHTFTYALYPHAGSVTEGGTIEEATALNMPLRAAIGGSHAAGRSVVKLDNSTVAVDALKKAEKEDCLILRIHECRGASGKVTITSDFGLTAYASCNLLEETQGEIVNSSQIEVHVKPFQIKTFKLYFK